MSAPTKPERRRRMPARRSPPPTTIRQHIARLCTEREANADLARALGDEIRQHAVDPERAQHEAHRAEQSQQNW